MEQKIVVYQQEALKTLSGKADNFYLAGGTALSLFYFHHRLSVDLDFFTRDFMFDDVLRIVLYLKNTLKKKVSLVGKNLNEKTAKIAAYNIHFTAKDLLKIDFVEDVTKLLRSTKVVDGIRILSLEDIYLRKLYALAGMIRITDETGRGKFIGGRIEAKDFYDVYFLSNTFIPLSKFAVEYCDDIAFEAIVGWFRTYDRMTMMGGVLDLITDKAIDYKAMEKHFKQEIDKMIGYGIGEL
jgi:predicted nucleotidyltransferase component of viral defense system